MINNAIFNNPVRKDGLKNCERIVEGGCTFSWKGERYNIAK